MIILVDNYDSFTYNLFQYIGNFYSDVSVCKNDDNFLDNLDCSKLKAIIFSPGPGKPSSAGKMPKMIDHYKFKVPLLGICLGHQAIIESFGGKIHNANNICHGKVHEIRHNSNCLMFNNVKTNFYGTRYHSLVASEINFPECLEITAKTIRDDEIMAIKHKTHHIYGLQFHPESIETIYGMQMIENFINAVK